MYTRHQADSIHVIIRMQKLADVCISKQQWGPVSLKPAVLQLFSLSFIFLMNIDINELFLSLFLHNKIQVQS